MPSSLNDPRHWLDFVPDTLHVSPLYHTWWQHLKDDEEILALLELVQKDQPLPITFFTAVNFLVLGEPETPLAQFYPYLQPEGTRPASEVYPVFRAFVLAHQETLRAILPTARLQTNEVTRCANLLPAFILAYRRGGSQPLNMLEIGSSAGLNLLWMRYAYCYRRNQLGPDLRLNGLMQPVHVQCTLEASPTFPLSSSITLPRVARCQGIEICPRNVHDKVDMRWVRAAIWPEEVERYRTLDTALALARQSTLSVHVGDARDLLPTLLAAMPTTHTAVVWHSYAINQGPVAVRERVHAQLAEASQRQPIYRIALEVASSAGPQLALSEYRDGKIMQHETLAQCALHGERMRWVSESGLL